MKIFYPLTDKLPELSVATIGFFDGVHRGHRYLINQVKEIAEQNHLFSAVVTFINHPLKTIKPDFHPELLNSLDEKLNLLSQTGVDYCFLLDFSQETAQLPAHDFMQYVLQQRYHVGKLVIGYDHRFGHDRQDGFDDYCRYGHEIGMEVIQATFMVEGGRPISSSLIRKYLHKGDMAGAADCLGYDYMLRGTVVPGQRIGRTIGFPTANLQVNVDEKLIPANGVYAVKVMAGAQVYPGMLNIGTRPTVDDSGKRTIEVHLLHYSGNLYQQEIVLYFKEFIRSERSFSSLDELRSQLIADAGLVEKLLS